MRDLVPLRRSTFELGLPRSQLSPCGQQAYTNAENAPAHQARQQFSPTEEFSYTFDPLPIYFRFIRNINDRSERSSFRQLLRRNLETRGTPEMVTANVAQEIRDLSE